VNNQNNETYLNHPTFGLLYKVCTVNDDREIYTTLYAQRLFFVVTIEKTHLNIEPLTRSDARLLVENRLRRLRSTGSSTEYQEINAIYKRTF
jgi:PII interaction protein X